MRSAEFLRKDAERYGIELFSVSAIIENKDKILFFKKIPSDNSEELVVLPNGRVEFGETLISTLKKKLKKDFNLSILNVNSYVDCHDYVNSSGKNIREFIFKVDIEDIDKLNISLFDYVGYFYINPITEMANFDNLSIPYGLKKVIDKYSYNKKH